LSNEFAAWLFIGQWPSIFSQQSRDFAFVSRQAQSGAANEDTANDSAAKTLTADRFSHDVLIFDYANDFVF
jgi:hypothetical protein